MKYSKGDELVLKVEDDFGYTDKTYRSVKVQVIGYNIDSEMVEAEYLVYVPSYLHIKESWVLSPQHARHYCTDRKFIGETVAFIDVHHPIYKHIPAAPGEHCNHCGDFFEGTARNVDDKYLCRACMLNPYR
jgi:formylmethanofuran dehydrogenase subunit E